jgi:O-antigen/teichoic acid export membrane protein
MLALPTGARLVLHRAGWSLIDQSIVSLGTFLVSVILARHLASAEYGVFAILLATALTLQLVNVWLVAYPLGVRLAAAEGEVGAQLSTSSIVLVAMLCVPLSVVIGILLVVLHRADLVWAAIVWFVLWQIQQGTRRVLLADLCHRGAVVGDAVASLGQVLAVTVIARGGHLSLVIAFYGMAAASALGAVHQAFQIRLVTHGLCGPRRWLTENASLGSWSLTTGLVATLRGHLLFWPLVLLWGTAMMASLQAALNIFFLLNPIQLGLNNLIPQITARAYGDGNKRTAWRAAKPYIFLALPPILIYVAFVLTFAPLVLRTFYGQGSPYLDLGDLFPALAVCTIALIMTELINCYFLGIREARLALKINLLGVAVISVLAVPLFAAFGPLAGSCLALAVGDSARLCAALIFLWQLIGSEKPLAARPQGADLNPGVQAASTSGRR